VHVHVCLLACLNVCVFVCPCAYVSLTFLVCFPACMCMLVCLDACNHALFFSYSYGCLCVYFSLCLNSFRICKHMCFCYSLTVSLYYHAPVFLIVSISVFGNLFDCASFVLSACVTVRLYASVFMCIYSLVCMP